MRHAHRTALFHRKAKQARTPFERKLGPAGLFAGVSLMALAGLMHSGTPAWAQGEFAVDVTDPNVQVDLSVLNDGGIGPRMSAPVPAATAATAAPTTGQGGYRAPGPKPPVSTLYIQPSGDYALPPQTKPLIAEPQAEPAPSQDDAPTQTARAPEPVAAPEPVQEAAAPEPVEASAPEPVDIPEPPQETLAAPEPVSTPAPVSEPAPQEQEVAQEAAQEVAKAAPTPPPAPEVAQEPTPEPAPEPQPAPAAESAAAPAEDIPPPPPAVGDAAPKPEAEAEPAPARAQKPADLTAPERTVAQAAPEKAAEEAPQQAQDKATAPANKVTLDLPPKLDTPNQPGVAALPPATDGIGEQDGVRIVFEADSSKLPTDAREALSVLAKRLEGDDTLRLQLLAYAGDADTSASAARRLSLSRALAVRSYLIENGVRSTRIDVRALGNKSTDDVTERVDVNVMER